LQGSGFGSNIEPFNRGHEASLVFDDLLLQSIRKSEKNENGFSSFKFDLTFILNLI